MEAVWRPSWSELTGIAGGRVDGLADSVNSCERDFNASLRKNVIGSANVLSYYTISCPRRCTADGGVARGVSGPALRFSSALSRKGVILNSESAAVNVEQKP